METTRDFGSLDESVFDVTNIANSLSMQFGGLECSGLQPPVATLESNVTNAYHMGNSHMVSMNESKVISDFERVVKDRLVLFKKEITCGTYEAPSWEEHLELRSQQEVLASQVDTLKAF